MQEFINQAKHNYKLHDDLCSKFSDTYFDWKITCLFYIANHYLQALAKKRRKVIGSSHVEINNNIRSGKHNPTMAISETARKNYMHLFHYSQTARYEGFTNFELFNELMKKDYEHALACFKQFRAFIKDNDIDVGQ